MLQLVRSSAETRLRLIFTTKFSARTAGALFSTSSTPPGRLSARYSLSTSCPTGKPMYVMTGYLSLRPSRCPLQTYGTGDQLRFDCHFGPRECEGNIYHACAAATIAGAQERLDYVRCMINDNYEPARAALRCSREVEVDWEEIERCATTSRGNRLHQLAGQKTQTLRPRVSLSHI